MFSIVEFGSSCRREIDASSDRDLLVVCPPSQKLELLKVYMPLGYSVSFYNERQLQGMKSSGSLFLQHLRNESKILEDVEDKFSTFLRSCEFVKPSHLELTRCREAINFGYCLQLGDFCDSWKADYLFCLIRDYLIKLLATKGVFAFGIPDIFSTSRTFWGLDQKDLRTLSTLRQIKALHRKGDVSFRDGGGLFNATSRLLQKIDNGISSSVLNSKVSVCDLLDHPFVNPYEQLRILEAVYILYRRSKCLHPQHLRIMALIEKPNMYGGATKLRQTEVARHMQGMLLELTANKSLPRTSDLRVPLLAHPERLSID